VLGGALIGGETRFVCIIQSIATIEIKMTN
jgi:hypothetical protein